MDDELLRTLYHRLLCCPDSAHTRNCTFSDGLIAFIELFRVGHQISAGEAMKRSRWPLWVRRIKFPSYSQFNRRVQTDSVQRLIAQLSVEYRDRLPRTGEKVIDGKPLIVGGFSKDPDARRGKAPGGWARGYKFHAVVDAGGAVETWDVTALNTGEATVAKTLVTQVDLMEAIVRTDGNYDSVELYALVADAGGRLIAPRRKPGSGLGHHPQHPDRLRAIVELEQTDGGHRDHERHRIRVEQIFGRLTMVAFGLWALPPSVRRLHRVRRWINAKIALYHLYLATQAQNSTKDAA